jgi:hypothetical protein
VSKAARLIPARIFRKWWERLIQLDQQEAEQGNAADLEEACDLLTRLDEIGHPNGAGVSMPAPPARVNGVLQHALSTPVEHYVARAVSGRLHARRAERA